MPVLTTIGESLYWSYAYLGMTHAAIIQGVERNGTLQFMIRSRLYKGLCSGKMNMASLAKDERLKLILPKACCYCGSSEKLSIDHLIPTHRGGPDVADNMVWSCRSCNSSKGAKDMLQWMEPRMPFPPLLLLRRYLKLAVGICRERGVMDRPLDDRDTIATLPFALERVPHTYPGPKEVVLWVVPLE